MPAFKQIEYSIRATSTGTWKVIVKSWYNKPKGIYLIRSVWGFKTKERALMYIDNKK